MGVFTLDTSTLASTGETITNVEVSTYGRWHQFEMEGSEDEAITVLGYVIYLLPGSEFIE